MIMNKNVQIHTNHLFLFHKLHKYVFSYILFTLLQNHSAIGAYCWNRTIIYCVRDSRSTVELFRHLVPVLRVSTSLRLLPVVLASLTVANCPNGEQP